MDTLFLPLYRKAQNPEQTHFCPGCGHGNILKFVEKAVRDIGAEKRCIWVSPVGCGGLTDSYLSVSHVLAPHGRASAVATAVKRIYRDALVIVSQGDGDLASIGLLEAIHAANRGENLTVIFINNANFGMTGGQMAPTSWIGQRTATSPEGRILGDHGAPLKICELFNQLEGPAYIARVALGNIKQLFMARQVIKKAVENQYLGRGYSFVEVLSPCPSNWHCAPQQARDRVAEEMTRVYPIGVFRDESRESWIQDRPEVSEYNAKAVTDALEELARPVSVLDRPVLKLDREYSLCCTGFGGQGVLTIGRAVARLALLSGLHATWIPSYGPEMRGGVANCFVRLSNREIGTPVVESPDYVIAMNQPSFESYLTKVSKGGVIYYDSDSIEASQREGIRVCGIPASSLAVKCGDSRSANYVLLGAFLRDSGWVSGMEDVVAALGTLTEIQKAAVFSGANA